jgi:hypothetical protein
MKTMLCILFAAVTSSCIQLDLSGFDPTTTPTPDDVVGSWRGFTAGAYARFEFASNGTGVVAMDLPGTNVNPDVYGFVWHTTSSNLVLEVAGTGTNERDRLVGRLLERTLVLNDPAETNRSDVQLVQIIRMDDCVALDAELERMIENHRRGTTSR